MEATRKPREILYIPPDAYVEGRGWRVSVVVEGDPGGHYPTGDWPYEDKPGQKLPWFWGPTLTDAQRLAAQYNLRLGVTPEEALAIVSESMGAAYRVGAVDRCHCGNPKYLDHEQCGRCIAGESP